MAQKLQRKSEDIPADSALGITDWKLLNASQTNQTAFTLEVDVKLRPNAVINPSKANVQVNPETVDIIARANKTWTDNGGELISLPSDEHASMLKTLASGAEDVVKTKPALQAAYQVMVAGAQRIK